MRDIRATFVTLYNISCAPLRSLSDGSDKCCQMDTTYSFTSRFHFNKKFNKIVNPLLSNHIE